MPNKNQFKTKEEYLEWYRNYRKKNRIKFRSYNREYNRKWRKTNGYQNENIWSKENPEKKRAHRKIYRALKAGKIKRTSCEVCGSRKSQGHHPNYNEPLKVIWLCPVHHKEIHRIDSSQ